MDGKTLFDLIKTVSFFDDFSLEEKKTVVDLNFDVVRFAPAKVIVREGDYEDQFFILLKGHAQVTKSQKAIAKLQPGALFGELSWLGKRARISSVIAETEVILFRLDLKKLQKCDPSIRDKIKDKIISNLIIRLEAMNAQLTRQKSG